MYNPEAFLPCGGSGVDMAAALEDAVASIDENAEKLCKMRDKLISELSKIEKADKRDFKINNTELAERFFGKNMYISASRIEKFYKCPFGYFCEFGMKLKPRKEAQVDAALYGTVIHFVLEQFLFRNNKTNCRDKKTF